MFLERITGARYLHGLAVQVAWILIFAFVARKVWKKGLKAYSADGG